MNSLIFAQMIYINLFNSFWLKLGLFPPDIFYNSVTILDYLSTAITSVTSTMIITTIITTMIITTIITTMIITSVTSTMIITTIIAIFIFYICTVTLSCIK